MKSWDETQMGKASAGKLTSNEQNLMTQLRDALNEQAHLGNQQRMAREDNFKNKLREAFRKGVEIPMEQNEPDNVSEAIK